MVLHSITVKQSKWMRNKEVLFLSKKLVSYNWETNQHKIDELQNRQILWVEFPHLLTRKQLPTNKQKFQIEERELPMVKNS